MRSVRWLALAAGLGMMLSYCGGNPMSPPPPAPTTPVVSTPPAAEPTPAPAPAATPAPPPAPTPTPAPVTAPVTQIDPACNCTPTDPPSGDYRHDAKHVPMIEGTPQEITVADVLAWAKTPDPGFTAPRSGRELQLFHISKAYLQSVWVVKDDCDLHMELSNTADPVAPRIIVETPIDPSYCPARVSLQTALKAKGLSMTWGTVNSIPVSVTGMAFADYDHKRGSQYVATPWELHPAITTVLP